MKRLIFLLLIIFLASFTAFSQTQCPPDMVCISPEAARKALIDSDTVKAQALQIKALEQAVKDAQDNTQKALIEFAKLHVEAALKEASKKAEAKNGPGEWSYLYVDENSIINSYPLTNII